RGFSTGTGETDFERISAILAAVPELQYICVDVANGYSEHFVHFVKDVREKFPSHTIMVGPLPPRPRQPALLHRRISVCQAGNVVTGEMVEELILAGADIIKVGIGPGSVCTTRKKTGDGGCTCPGDVSKAFGAGADFVMLGGMLAGHSESGGDIIEKSGKKYKLFLRNELRHGHEEARGGRGRVQSVGGQDGGGPLQRAGGGHDTGRAGRRPLHLHLRRGGKTEGAEPQDHLHQGHPAAQHSLRQRRLSLQRGEKRKK
ncbi:unnamed protein product, partial [Tetraodon nigroviridis]